MPPKKNNDDEEEINEIDDSGNEVKSSQEESFKKVKIKEFDLNNLYPHHPNDLKNGSKYLAIGKPGTGKSTIIKSIIYAKKHIFPVGKFWSGTEDSNGFFGEFVPGAFINDGLLDSKNPSDLKPFEDSNRRQRIARKYIQPLNQNPWSIEVVDDCTADPKILKTTVMKDTYKNGRHLAKMHILSLQFCLDIPTDIRGLIDGVFICREPNRENRERLFKNFGSGVDNFKEWCDLMDGLTTDFCCMFINYKSTSNKLEDNIFYFKADPKSIPKDWKFGCKEYWDFHYERYDPNHTVTF